MKRSLLGVAGVALCLGASPLVAQYPAGHQGSSNMKVLSHLPVGADYRLGDLDIEQELSRPYAYLAMRKDVSGFAVISLKDPAKAFILYQWKIENPELHMGG